MPPPGLRRKAINNGEDYYFTGKPCKRGHIAKRKVKGGCVLCIKDRDSQPKDKITIQKKAKSWRRKNPEKSLIRLANKRGWPVTITEKDIQIPKVCPVLGIPIVMGSRTVKDGSPTLDRVDTSKGYIKGNVEVISWRANRLKSDASLEEIKAIYKYMKRRLT